MSARLVHAGGSTRLVVLALCLLLLALPTIWLGWAYPLGWYAGALVVWLCSWVRGGVSPSGADEPGETLA